MALLPTMRATMRRGCNVADDANDRHTVETCAICALHMCVSRALFVSDDGERDQYQETVANGSPSLDISRIGSFSQRRRLQPHYGIL